MSPVTRKRIAPPMRATEKEKKMAIETTVGKLINGDTVIVDEGIPATIVEIVFHKEPLVSLRVHSERFGDMRIITADDMPVTILEEGE
jgi:hypothetical protein